MSARLSFVLFFFFRLAWASSRLAAHATAEAVCAWLSQVARDKFHLVALRALRVAEQKEASFFFLVFFALPLLFLVSFHFFDPCSVSQ